MSGPDRRPDPAFDPEPWLSLGISAQEGLQWWQHRVEASAAVSWRRAGVKDPLDAVRWRLAGVHPGTVREWMYGGIDAREAVVWTELGFNAAAARRHKRAGLSPVAAYGREHRTAPPASGGTFVAGPRGPRARAMGMPGGADARRFIEALGHRRSQVMHSYMQRQWFDDEAVAWALHEIDASEAVAWKELGLTPAEARRQQDAGKSAMATAKAWWQAGIPVGEVADWIGAGLTPTEAAEQRSSGVTAERAAILRSLRKEREGGR